jgi:hypothetical protein
MIAADPYSTGTYQVLELETHLHALDCDGQHSVAATSILHLNHYA